MVARRIAAEKPNLSFFTAHDSIATIFAEVDYVRKVIKEELDNYLGNRSQVSFKKVGMSFN